MKMVMSVTRRILASWLSTARRKPAISISPRAGPNLPRATKRMAIVLVTLGVVGVPAAVLFADLPMVQALHRRAQRITDGPTDEAAVHGIKKILGHRFPLHFSTLMGEGLLTEPNPPDSYRPHP